MPRIRPPGFESWLDLLQAWTHYFVSVSQFPMCQAGLIVPTPPPPAAVVFSMFSGHFELRWRITSVLFKCQRHE